MPYPSARALFDCLSGLAAKTAASFRIPFQGIISSQVKSTSVKPESAPINKTLICFGKAVQTPNYLGKLAILSTVMNKAHYDLLTS